MIHYYLHHFPPRGRLGRMLRERHMRHHFQDDTRGFGISAPYWDEVFRTSPARSDPRNERARGPRSRRRPPARSRLDALALRARAPAAPRAEHSTKGRAVAATNINRVVMTGNLTADPELRSLPSGTSVCKLRIACNTRRKNGSTGEWEDKPNYFDVTVWGAQGENAARYLAKGRPVAIDGRLEWREWEAQDGTKRQAVDIIADSVQFLGSREDGSGGGGFAGKRGLQGQRHPRRRRGLPARTGPGGTGDEDIPF